MTRANRAPLLFAAPGARPSVRRGYAELVDIYATLADLAGIAVPPRCDTEEQSQTLAACTEGASLKPLIMPQAVGGGGDVSGPGVNSLCVAWWCSAARDRRRCVRTRSRSSPDSRAFLPLPPFPLKNRSPANALCTVPISMCCF